MPAIQRVETHTGVIVERAIGDGAYGSGENLAACANYPAHPIDLVAPQARPDDPEVDKSAFQIDLAAKTAEYRDRLDKGATLDDEENYLIRKLFTAGLGMVRVSNQARI